MATCTHSPSIGSARSRLNRLPPGRLRTLPDSFLDVDQCFVVAKGNANRLAAIEVFVGEMRTSGFIKQSIDRAKLVGVSVAPVRKR